MYSLDQKNYIQRQKRSAVLETLVVFCLVCRLGFPGNFANILGGERVRLLFDYGSWMLQIAIMLMASGDTLMDVKVLDLKRKYLPVYLMLAVICTVSLFVSELPAKQATIIVRFCVTAFFGLWLADRYDTRELLRVLFSAQVVIVFVNLAAFFLFRNVGFYYEEGYGYTFRGIYLQKNGLGAAVCMGLILQTALLRAERLERDGAGVSVSFVLVFVLQFFLLVVSKSTSSLLTALLTILYLLLYDWLLVPELRLQWGVVYTAVSVGFLFLAMMLMPVMSPLLELIGKDATLSGRIPMWTKIIDFMIDSHTLTGYGLLMFWNSPGALKALQSYYHKNSWFRTMAYGAHNTILELWLDIGLIGIGAYLLTLIVCFRNKDRLSKAQYILCSACIIPNLLEGLTDRQYTNVNFTTLLFFVMLGVACSGQLSGGDAASRRGETAA